MKIMGDSTASRSVKEAGEKSTTKTTDRPPANSNCSKYEKDLNENILSRKREKYTEKLRGGMW